MFIGSHSRRAMVFACMALLLCGAAKGPSSATSVIEQHYQAVRHAQDITPDDPPYAVRQHRVVARYEALFGKHTSANVLASSDAADLQYQFLASWLVASWADTRPYAMRMSAVLTALERRGLATRDDYGKMAGVYLRARMFREARAFKAQHPSDLSMRIPRLENRLPHGYTGPTVMDVSPDGSTLVRTPADIGDGPTIVVVDSPMCYFAEQGMASIKKSRRLSSIFAKHTIWLIQPDGDPTFDGVAQWNREHPRAKMVVAFHRDEWKDIDRWGTPTFYFFRDGHLKARVIGWPSGGSKTEIVAAARKIGIL